MAWVLSNEPYNYDTRSCGTDGPYSPVPLSRALVNWAQEIVCAEHLHSGHVNTILKEMGIERPVKVLRIPDEYDLREPRLVELIKERYKETE